MDPGKIVIEWKDKTYTFETPTDTLLQLKAKMRIRYSELYKKKSGLDTALREISELEEQLESVIQFRLRDTTNMYVDTFQRDGSLTRFQVDDKVG